MQASGRGPAEGWQYGLDPALPGMTLIAIEREQHPLGDALRLELAAPGEGDTVHIQWFIATEMIPWAMWTSCPRSEVPAREAAIRAITWSLDDLDRPVEAVPSRRQGWPG